MREVPKGVDLSFQKCVLRYCIHVMTAHTILLSFNENPAAIILKNALNVLVFFVWQCLHKYQSFQNTQSSQHKLLRSCPVTIKG